MEGSGLGRAAGEAGRRAGPARPTLRFVALWRSPRPALDEGLAVLREGQAMATLVPRLAVRKLLVRLLRRGPEGGGRGRRVQACSYHLG